VNPNPEDWMAPDPTDPIEPRDDSPNHDHDSAPESPFDQEMREVIRAMSRRDLIRNLGKGLITAFGAAAFLDAAGIEVRAQGSEKPDPEDLERHLRSKLKDPEKVRSMKSYLTERRAAQDGTEECVCPTICACNCESSCNCTCTEPCDCKCTCTCSCDCGCECICECTCACACEVDPTNDAKNADRGSLNVYRSKRAPSFTKSINRKADRTLDSSKANMANESSEQGVAGNLLMSSESDFQASLQTALSDSGGNTTVQSEAAADESTVNSVYVKHNPPQKRPGAWSWSGLRRGR
jgi:hypothetical protein